MFGWTVSNPARQFADLIWGTCAKYPVWDPGNEDVKVGDYGKLDKTGLFKLHGNIYDPNQEPWLVELMKKHPPKHSVEEYLDVSSMHATAVDLGPDASGTLPLVNLKVKCKYSFSKGVGAVLIVHQPRHVSIPRELKCDDLLRLKALKGMSLVTKVITCPAYALYLSSKGDASVNISLGAQASAPLAGGAEVALKWDVIGGGGYRRMGAQKDYTVLYELQDCKKRILSPFRDDDPGAASELESEGLDQLQSTDPPWDPIDDDGEEAEMCD